MRWMWIDQIIDYERDRRLVAIKNVSLAEEHLHDHFAADGDEVARPVMPASLLIEGMAQTAGILVGSINQFRENVILAKIQRAEFTVDVFAGQSVRFDAVIDRIDGVGASTHGIVSRLDHREGRWREFGVVDLIFSHVDRSLSTAGLPDHNFVFSENFRTILRAAGLDPVDQGDPGDPSGSGDT